MVAETLVPSSSAASPPAPRSRASRGARHGRSGVGRDILLTTLAYYWAYLYFRVLLPPPKESVVSYLIAVIPIALATVLGLLAAPIASKQSTRLTGLDILLLGFVALAAIASLARSDLASLRGAGLMALALLWIARSGAALTVGTLNKIFLASVAAGGLSYLLGISEYGLLPGQYSEGVDRGLEWRISLFPFVPESGFFALVVFLANQLYRTRWTRLWLCSASAYFVVFSGMRSALLALLLAEIYVVLMRYVRGATSRAALIVLLLTIFVGSIIIASVAAIAPTFLEGPLGNYLFRTASFADSDVALSQTVYRGWLWAQHIDLFRSSPLAGVGTFDFQSVVTESLVEGKDDSGSEAFVTGWLARLGLCFLPFVAYLWLLCRRAGAQGPFQGSVFLVFGVAAFAYGSFLVPYNFMFILLFALLLSRSEVDALVQLHKS